MVLCFNFYCWQSLCILSGVSRKSQSEFAAGHPSSWSCWHAVWSDKEEGIDPIHTAVCVRRFEQDGWCVQDQCLWSREGIGSPDNRRPDTGPFFLTRKRKNFVLLLSFSKPWNLFFFQWQARIDSHNKILYARHADQRSATFQKVLQMGNEFDRDVRSMMLRANLLKHEYHAKGRKPWEGRHLFG